MKEQGLPRDSHFEREENILLMQYIQMSGIYELFHNVFMSGYVYTSSQHTPSQQSLVEDIRHANSMQPISKQR
jgi:hypothetical protein